MRKQSERNVMINKLAITGFVCCVLGTAGCVSAGTNGRATNPGYPEEQCSDGICTSNSEYTAVCVENAAGYSECTDNTAVNYTQTQADFRAYGERSPRDHRITQAAAGNNISASVMPSINDEVVEYEAEISGNPQATIATPEQAQMFDQVDTVVGQGAGEIEDTDVDNPNKDWLAEEGQSLKDLLVQWSEEAGWRLIWKTNRNYTLNAGAMFRGKFADVASALVRAFARARPAPVATFYKGNRVLVIETKEDENAYD
jgi:hypothetical protein